MNLFIVVVGGVIKYVHVINVILMLSVDVNRMNFVNGMQQQQMVLLMKVKMYVFKMQIVNNVNYGINIVGDSLIQIMIHIINVEMNNRNLPHQILHVILYVLVMKCV